MLRTVDTFVLYLLFNFSLSNSLSFQIPSSDFTESVRFLFWQPAFRGRLVLLDRHAVSTFFTGSDYLS